MSYQDGIDRDTQQVKEAMGSLSDTGRSYGSDATHSLQQARQVRDRTETEIQLRQSALMKDAETQLEDEFQKALNYMITTTSRRAEALVGDTDLEIELADRSYEKADIRLQSALRGVQQAAWTRGVLTMADVAAASGITKLPSNPYRLPQRTS
jgi:hypothetical protein